MSRSSSSAKFPNRKSKSLDFRGSLSIKTNQKVKMNATTESDGTATDPGSSQKSSRGKSSSSSSKPTSPSLLDLNGRANYLDDLESLTDDCTELYKQLECKDNKLEKLETTVDALQCQLMKVSYENKVMAEKVAKQKSADQSNDLQCQLKNVSAFADSLTCNVQELECHLNELRNDLSCMKKEQKISFDMKQKCLQENASCGDTDTQSNCPSSRSMNFVESANAKKLKCLQNQYASLQQEYCRKEKESNSLADRLKKFSECCGDDKEKAENNALRSRAKELEGEITDYKLFVKELQDQVDSYREKFMKAQEKVEEQRYMLENLEMSSKDVECRINEEMARIKEKFQEKLAQLCPYPKLYEESFAELEESKEKIKELEVDLKASLAALSKSQCELKALKNQPESLESKYKKLLCEVEMLKTKYCSMKETKDCLEEKLTCMKNELENLRKDSSRIITTTKCCAEKNRQILHQQINCLEVELAQCRASSVMSLAEKEEIIKKMKTELACLCGQFSNCQDQICQLQNHVVYLTNQRHKSRDTPQCCSEFMK